VNSSRRPGPAVRLLSPESWAPAVAKKLREGTALDEWECIAAAECLEHAAGLSASRKRKGRLRKLPASAEGNPLKFQLTVHFIVTNLHRQGIISLTRDGFRYVAQKFIIGTSATVIERAYQAEAKRLRHP